ncbi:LysM peptidoglycan-binding domain-containing protein [Fulvivirga sp. M361]|uniref:LysM peptidoglycan-binding domain-containing protein n=1 Tax=Fulvivirga sp. M361 TaxID=2594266 RepID=UPI001179E393|nr:LysM peptidoglycan-binding domain-containing protein [Fulvivirga sp. M361]TRX59377.1 LysM peptidoglycan-binding domain-containing protein [Fulvivirga sp. M361]
MRSRFLALLVLLPVFCGAQVPRVPAKMEFANLKLRIADGARAEIQKDVDRLHRSPTYFNIQVEKAKSYFPIIEKVFAREKLPDDFKYLVLQESGLVSDAVSSSKAVGFWQFKDFTAMEVGLRVDRHVDERMNIVSASHGAAKYLKKNNFTYFDNWLMALQAYQMGAGAALKAGVEKYRGDKSMVINKKTYWYVKKYLAHKIAYQDAIKGEGQLKLIEHHAEANETLSGIAAIYRVDADEVKEYNKWLKRGKIPSDKNYVVIVPSDASSPALLASNHDRNENTVTLSSIPEIAYNFDDPAEFPKIKGAEKANFGSVIVINGLRGIIAGPTDKIPQLAKKGRLELAKFLKYNDLDIDDKVKAGQAYYLRPKKSKGKTHYHVVQPGETLWDIAQKYAVKLKKLRLKNRMKDDAIKPGRVIWLRYIRPAKVPIEYREVETAPEVPVQVVDKEVIEVLQVTTSEEEAKDQEIDERVTQPLTLPEKLDSLEQLQDAPPLSPSDSLNEEHKEYVTTEKEPSSISTLDEEVAGQQDQTGTSQLSRDVVRRTHVVVAGETFYAISKIYGVSVLNILEWNNLKINDKLSIGQELTVYPEQSSGASAESIPKETLEEDEKFILYTVIEGDTLYSIARNHGVTIQDIVQWNDKKELSIKLGEKIKIKNSMKVK